MLEKLFYVYAHYRLSDGTVFYIGKGIKNRAHSRRDRNPHWHRTVAKHGIRIEIWANDLSEDQAFVMEKEWIALYGRKDLKTGRLVNMTEGGDGSKGYVITPEIRAKISAKSKGRKQTLAQRARTSARMKGTKRGPLSAAHKAKIKATNTGVTKKPHTPETKAKISASKKGTKISPELSAKFSALRIGKKIRPCSPERREKSRLASTGKTHTKESKAKLSASLKGRVRSPKHCANLSAAIIGKKHPPERTAKSVATQAKNRAAKKALEDLKIVDTEEV